MAARDRRSFAEVFYERVRGFSYGQWLLVVVAISMVVTLISVLVGAW